MRLRLTTDQPEDPPQPIPFPRDRGERVAPGRRDDRRRGGDRDPARDAEAALDDIQRDLRELEEMLDSLPFPIAEEDDGPRAA